MDEKYWGDPEVFRPERFLNEMGEYVPDKRVCHFGFGTIGKIYLHLLIKIMLTKTMSLFIDRQTSLHWNYFSRFCNSHIFYDHTSKFQPGCCTWPKATIY